MNYIYSPIESKIKRLYHQLSIFVPEQIDMVEIAARLNINLFFYDDGSVAVDNNILIDKRIDPKEQWQEFSHELGHCIRHSGNQLILTESFRKMQESQAENYCYHFAVPTFMLLTIELPETRSQAIEIISQRFNVTLEFATERLKRFERQLNGTLFHEKYVKYLKEPGVTYKEPGVIYLDDDLEPIAKFERLLNKLNITENKKEELLSQFKQTYNPVLT